MRIKAYSSLILGIILLLLSISIAIVYSLPLFSFPKYSSLSYMVCSDSISMASSLTRIIQFKTDNKIEEYGLTLDPSKYCFFSLTYDIDKDFESGIACKTLNYLLNTQFLDYFKAFYGNCPRDIKSDNYAYWASLYMATIIDRAMEICYSLYNNKHPEDPFHLNVFPCFSLYFESYLKNRIRVYEKDLLLVEIFGRKRFYENIIASNDENKVNSFIDWNFLPYRIEFKKGNEKYSYETYNKRLITLYKFRLENKALPIERFIFYYLPYSNSKNFYYISPGDYVYIYYVDPLVTKSITELAGDLTQYILSGVIRVILLTAINSIGSKIFSPLTEKAISYIGEDSIKAYVSSLIENNIYKAFYPVIRLYEYKMLIPISNLASAFILENVFPNFFKIINYYLSTDYLLRLKEISLENGANFMVLVHKTSDQFTYTSQIKLLNYLTYDLWKRKGFDCQVKVNTKITFKGDSKCIAYFYCKSNTRECFVKEFRKTISIPKDNIYIAGFVLDKSLVGNYNYEQFFDLLKKEINDDKAIVYIILQ